MGDPVAGRYEILGEIASGGMGAVYLAEDRVLNRRVALKRLHPHLDADTVARTRFEQEALAAASLTHPGIITVYDAGEDEQGAFLVMELVDGETLADQLHRDGPLISAEAAALGAAVARALQHAHERGIVHRDVKPGNILLLDGHAKIGDFGIAKALDAESGATSTGMVVGTAGYLSPEQAMGEPATHASDIYALGVVLYEAVSGRKPFTGTPIAVALAHRTEPPPPLPEDVDPGLASVIARALAKAPEERFGSAGDMAGALERIAGGDTIVVPLAAAATSDDTAELAATEVVAASTLGRRRRWPILAGTLAALMLIALLLAVVVPVVFGSGTPAVGSRLPAPTKRPRPTVSATVASNPSPTSSPTTSPSPKPTKTGGGGGPGPSPQPSPTPPSPPPSPSPSSVPSTEPSPGTSP